LISRAEDEFNNILDTECYANTADLSMECESGENCGFSCDDSYECLNTFIDGSLYEYLSLDCSDYDSCMGAVVNCPIGGCSIKCSDSYSCKDMMVTYNGVRGDEGKVEITCSDYYACYALEVYADKADFVSLKCTSDEGYENYVCYDVVFYASDAGDVEITGNHKYAIYSSDLHVENAVSVSLYARGNCMLYYLYILSPILRCTMCIYPPGRMKFTNFFPEGSFCLNYDAFTLLRRCCYFVCLSVCLSVCPQKCSSKWTKL